MSVNQFSLDVNEWAGKRCTYTTKKPFEHVVQALRASVARFPVNFSFLWTEHGNPTPEQFEAFLAHAATAVENPSGLFLFSEVDHGRWYRVFQPNTVKFHRFVIGNPLVLKNMLHDPGAGLHAPWNFLLLEVRDSKGDAIGTKVLFDLPSRITASNAEGEALDEETRKLDTKFKEVVESWL